MNSGAGPYDVATIALLGGHLSLDFVNSIEDRTSRHPDDTLRTADDLRRWGQRLGILDDGPVDGVVRSELSRAIALREALLALLHSRLDHSTPDPADLHALTREVTAAFRAAQLASRNGTLRPEWNASSLPSVRHRIAVDALALLSEDHGGRLRRCDNAECGWYFLDSSKGGQRRWCSMEGCGTLAKTRRRQRA